MLDIKCDKHDKCYKNNNKLKISKRKRYGGMDEQQITKIINKNINQNVNISKNDAIIINNYLKQHIDDNINNFKNIILNNTPIILNNNNQYSIKQRFDFCFAKIKELIYFENKIYNLFKSPQLNANIHSKLKKTKNQKILLSYIEPSEFIMYMKDVDMIINHKTLMKQSLKSFFNNIFNIFEKISNKFSIKGIIKPNLKPKAQFLYEKKDIILQNIENKQKIFDEYHPYLKAIEKNKNNIRIMYRINLILNKLYSTNKNNEVSILKIKDLNLVNYFTIDKEQIINKLNLIYMLKYILFEYILYLKNQNFNNNINDNDINNLNNLINEQNFTINYTSKQKGGGYINHDNKIILKNIFDGIKVTICSIFLLFICAGIFYLSISGIIIATTFTGPLGTIILTDLLGVSILGLFASIGISSTIILAPIISLFAKIKNKISNK